MNRALKSSRATVRMTSGFKYSSAVRISQMFLEKPGGDRDEVGPQLVRPLEEGTFRIRAADGVKQPLGLLGRAHLIVAARNQQKWSRADRAGEVPRCN